MKLIGMNCLAKMARVACLALLLTATSFNAIHGQEEGDTDQATQVNEALKVLNGHMVAGEWTDVQKLMTEDAWDAYCSRLVRQATSMVNIEIELELPGLSDAQDAIADVLEEHGLDDLDIKSSFELKFGDATDDGDEGEEDEDEEDKSEMEKEENPVLIALDKDGKREEIIQALFKANSQSPFNMSLFNGKVEDVEAKEGDEETIFVKVTPKPQERESGDGMQIKMMSPPMVIVMQKDGDGWKYGGMDMKRTAAEMKNFSPRGSEPRTDF